MPLERFRFRAMGSPCEIQLWSDSRNTAATVADACGREIDRLERKFSRYLDDSLASEINRSAGNSDGIEVDAETAALLDFAAAAHHESDGRFDPTSGVLRRIWDFKSGRLPDPDRLREIRTLVGWSKLEWANPRIVLPISGMELDFGGFVKEYAADRAAELCRERGVMSGMIDLGGDLAVVGPHLNGESWLIGIRNPRKPSEAIARIALDSGGLASSGDYERFMIVDGQRYSHLLDPRTGECHRGGPACVSVTAPHCLVAGVTSTIAMLFPESDAPHFLQNVGLSHLLVTQSGSISGTADHLDAEPDHVGRGRPVRLSSSTNIVKTA
jgi:thiamine biosynthesis lipoprotein